MDNYSSTDSTPLATEIPLGTSSFASYNFGNATKPSEQSGDKKEQPKAPEPVRIDTERVRKVPPNPSRRLSVIGDLPTFTNEVVIIRPK
jgi:hypothetical protein